MKKINAKGKLKYLMFAIPLLLCAAIISLLLFTPKDTDSASNKPTAQSIIKTDATDLTQAAQNEEKPVLYRLIYAKKRIVAIEDQLVPKKSDNLVDDCLQMVVDKFKGPNVYFRVEAVPVVVHEESMQEDYTAEKREEILKQRMEYIKEIGAVDIVQKGAYRCYMTVNAEMIDKIGKAGGCRLYLLSVPRPEGYDEKISDYIAYALENIKEGDTVKAKIEIKCPEDEKTLNEILSENKIKDSQLTFNSIHENYANLRGSFTKDQILALAANRNVKYIFDVFEGKFEENIEDYIEIINVTEDTKITK